MQQSTHPRRGLLAALVLAVSLALLPNFANAQDSKDSKTQPLKVLIIGANGSVARVATTMFLDNTNVNLKLFLRNAKRLEHLKSPRVEVVEGDATNKDSLVSAMQNVNVVYANLYGKNTPQMAQTIIEAMHEVGLKRLVWITSFGVYNGQYQEIPDSELARIASYIAPHREEVRIIEDSDIDYTIIRAQWFSNADEIDYELTQKGEAFKNPSARISRKSIADLIVRLCTTPAFGVRQSFGINKPAPR
ncbi:SDR family oxidoreductase [Helicobacter sp. MIT 05-5294]|uniref:SDR family oxidoreductase n=1 Tax=Helicobacter sp. MIT 05-5294 TaxID=1548150 RepID=UPI000A724469|nr:SDR family oxidoreductase [Helicobacter sp. MIT 05-5294]TLD86183.1 SDR family oxidoreductase [Helicobacter sp. MIT 05-5294]